MAGAGRAELEAGSLLLARGGVCLLGDLSKYRRDTLQTLQKGDRGGGEEKLLLPGESSAAVLSAAAELFKHVSPCLSLTLVFECARCIPSRFCIINTTSS